MPTVNLLPIGNDAPFFLPTGVAASGYKLFTYAAGTTTKTNTYTDNTGNTANANPIILNSSGYPASAGNVIEIWGLTGTTYKFVLAPSTDSDPPVAAIWSRDNIPNLNDPTLVQSEWNSAGTPTYIGATQFSLTGDQTATWTIGRRAKATVTAGTVYGRVTASAFTTLTTVTLQLDGSQALDSGLSAVFYALLSSLVKSEPERIGTSSGTDTYTATVGITRLVIGDEFKVKIASTNTSTTPTLNLDGAGAKTVIRIDGSALLAGDLNGQHIFRWDGTNQVVLNPVNVKRTQISETQSANTIFAGPASGAAAAPTFRSPVGADGASWVLLSTGTAANSATIDFTTLSSTYNDYVVVCEAIVPATNGAIPAIRMSVDGGSTYKAGATDYQYATTALTSGAASDAAATTGDTGLRIIGTTGPSSTSSNGGYNATIFLFNMNATSAIKNVFFSGSYINSGGVFESIQGGGTTNLAALNNAAINAIRFIMSSGNITSGVFYLYGIRKT